MKKPFTRCFAATAVAMGVAFAANATDYTWTGAADAYWTNAANWTVGGGVATAIPGTADKAIFPELTGDSAVINLDGAGGVKEAEFNAGATAYQLGLATADNQALRLGSGGKITVNSGVTANQTVMCVLGTGGGTIYLYNYSTAKLVYKRLSKKGSNYNLWLYGTGTIEQDGPTSFDQVGNLQKRSTGLLIMGDTSFSSGSRISMFATYEVSGHIGEYHQIQIPNGRYLNTCGGGWSSLIFEANENARIYGDGVIPARSHWNTGSKGSVNNQYCGNFKVVAGKTLKVESFLKRVTDVGIATTGPGVFGEGTLYLCCSNNLVGCARIEEQGGTIACDKIGNKGAGDSNLGTGTEIRYIKTGTLEYRGTVDEATDRDLTVSNNTGVVSMILANAAQVSGKTLTWNGTAIQMYADGYGAKVRFNAVNGPVICNGTLGQGSSWGIEIDGNQGVYLRKDYGENVPVTILDDGKLILSNDVAISSPISVSGANAVIEIGENCQDITLPNVPVMGVSAALNIIVPQSSSVKIAGASGLRLVGITINGTTAKVNENGYIVSDGTVCGTSVWTNIVSGGAWETAGNWLNERVPNDFDSVIISNLVANDKSYTIKVNGAKSVQGIVEQADKGGNHTLQGNETFTIGADGYTLLTNTYYTSEGTTGHSQSDGGPMNFDVPLHLGASQQWLLGSHHGYGATYGEKSFTKNLSSEEGVEWDIYGYARLRFKSGNSDNFKGTVKVGSFIQFAGTNQFHRLGKRGVTLVCTELTDENNTGTKRMSPGLTFMFNNGETNGVCSTPIGVDITKSVTSKGRNGWCCDTVPICMGLSGSIGGTHVLTLNGALSGCAAGGSYLTFAQTDSANQPAGNRSFNYYPEDQKIVLAGDGRQFSLGQNQSVRLHTMIEIANAHSLGNNNSAAVMVGYDGYWGSQMFSTVQGVFLRPGLTYNGGIAASGSTDQNGIQNRVAYMLVGGAANDESDTEKVATFNGGVAESGANGFRLRLTSGKGTNTRFVKKITTKVPLACPYGEHPDIIGLGDVTLANSANSFGTNVCVRSGRLVMEHADAAGKMPVWLGGYVPTMAATKYVRCVSASPNELSGSATIKNEPETGTVQYYGKNLYFANVQTFDGVSPKAGDYVLINWPLRYAQNGIWRVTDDVKHWVRPDEMDEPDDIIGKVGLRVKVSEGKRFAGKAFMLVTNPVYLRKSVQTGLIAGGERFNGGDGAPVFHPEPSAEPQVALLTGVGGLTVPYAVEVTDNATTNASIIGSKVANTNSCFSGAINLAKDVTLSAADNALLSFTGSFNGSGNIIGAGEGTNDITAATLSIDADNGFEFASGVTRVTAEQLGSRPLVWRRSASAGSATGDTTGCLEVVGDLDLSQHEISFEGFRLKRDQDNFDDREWTIVSASGNISNLGEVSLPSGWSIKVSGDGKSLVLAYTKPGMVLLFK